MKHYLKKDLCRFVVAHDLVVDFIQEGSLDALLYWDVNNPESGWMNKKLWRKLGFSLDQLSDDVSAWQGIINQADLKLAVDAFYEYCDNLTGSYDQTVRYLHKNGSKVSIRCLGTVIRDGDGKPIRMLGAYSTENNLLEQAVKQIDQVDYWRSILENMNDGFQIIDENFRYVYLNKKTVELSKYPANSLIGKTMMEMYPGIESTDIFRAIKSVLKTKKQKSMVVDFTFPNGKLETYYNIIQPLENCVCVFTSQIPERFKAIYKRLKDSEQRWKFALEGAKDGVWDWNLETNEVYFSSQWKAMLGFKNDEIQGSLEERSKRIHPDDLQTCYDDIQKHLNGEEEIYSNIHRAFCKDGSYKWILDRGKVVERDVNGKPLRMVGTHTDLTERIEAEEQLNKKNKELEQFTYLSSHDLQEPLNTILSYSKLLEREKDNFVK